MNGRIPILRLNVKGDKHVVECLDRPYNFWYVVKSFGSTTDDFRQAILWLQNELDLHRKQSEKI